MKLFSISILAIGMALVTGCSKQEAPKAAAPTDDAVPVTVAKVELVPMDRVLPVVGTLCPNDEATIAAQVEGRIEGTMAEFGDRVKRDQEIALIDTASYEALARQSAAAVARAKANATNTQQNLTRIRSLAGDNIASASDLDKVSADAAQAAAEVKAAEAAEAIAQLNLIRSRVKAPFDGAVSERLATMGDFAKVATPLFRIVNDEVLKFVFQVPEAYAHEVNKDQSVRLSVDDWPTNIFDGSVFLISPQVNTNNRSFQVAARVPNADRKLKANSYARGEVLLEKGVKTPTVPLDAVVAFAGVTRVFVVESEVARSRPVSVGRIQNGLQEIVEGVKPGEIVACSGHSKLTDGSKIRLRDAGEGASGKMANAEKRP